MLEKRVNLPVTMNWKISVEMLLCQNGIIVIKNNSYLLFSTRIYFAENRHGILQNIENETNEWFYRNNEGRCSQEGLQRLT